MAGACLSDRLRKRVADNLEIDGPRFKPGYDPVDEETIANQELLVGEAQILFKERTVEEWLTTLDQVGVPCGPVKYIQELLDAGQVIAKCLDVDQEHSVAGPVRMGGPMISMSKTPRKAQGASPALGQHTDEILASLGLDSETIQRLKDNGVTR